MGLITVEGIRVFAYHGHLPEEAILGGHFIVNVWVPKSERNEGLLGNFSRSLGPFVGLRTKTTNWLLPIRHGTFNLLTHRANAKLLWHVLRVTD